jgi:amidophosphoribosyltransferase
MAWCAMYSTSRRWRCCPGVSASAHCRYPTAGSEGSDEAQPFYVNSPFGIALAHNGNLINTDALRREVFEQDRRNVNTESDSEVLLNVFAHELDLQKALTPGAVFRALEGVNRRAKGGYAVVCAVLGLGLVGIPRSARHPPAGAGQARGRGRRRRIHRGLGIGGAGHPRLRAVARCRTGRGHRDHRARRAVRAAVRAAAGARALHLRVRVLRAAGLDDREHLGAQGAHAHGRDPRREDPARAPRPRHRRGDPDPRHQPRFRTGNRQCPRREIPRGLHQEPLRRPHLHHAGAGRAREVGARKLNPIPLEFRNRVVLLVDDSIVRGTTSKQIVQMARDAGAKKVYLASAAPPVRYPNIYGIDMPSSEELVAHGRSEKDIEQLLGCDWLIYQELSDLEAAVAGPKFPGRRFDSSCFSGEYVTGIEAGYFERLQQLRSDDAKKTRRAS